MVFLAGAYFLIIGLIQSSGGLNPNAVAHDGDLKVGDTVMLAGPGGGPHVNITGMEGPDSLGRTYYRAEGAGVVYPETERQWFEKSELVRVGNLNQFAGIRDLKGIFRMP